MTNGNQSIRPGWYDNGRGGKQWHDGTAWTTVLHPDSLKRERRRVPLVLLGWAAAGSMFLGIIFGVALSPAGPQAENAAVIPSPSASESAATATLLAEQETLVEERAALAVQQTAADKREKALDKKEAQIVEDRRILTKAQQKVEKQAKQVEKAKKKAKKANNPAPTYAYYDNCAAARAAGAAPVYAGDPGYGSHLDRDGDGVGCE